MKGSNQVTARERVNAWIEGVSVVVLCLVIVAALEIQSIYEELSLKWGKGTE